MRKGIFRKSIALLLCAAMLFSMMSSAFAVSASDFSDMPADWSRPALERAIANGLLSGANGKINAAGQLSRAEMASIVVRAFGAAGKADLSAYSDVKPSDWYYADMQKAVAMGVISGSNGRLNPTAPITREEVCAVLYRAFLLRDGGSAARKFGDYAAISDWAEPAVAAMSAAGHVAGDAHGNMNPGKTITRAEFAQMMDNLVKSYPTGSVSGVIGGNAIVKSASADLSGAVIQGDLILADGLGKASVDLSNCTVEGRVIVRGGGEVKLSGAANAERVVAAIPDGKLALAGKVGTVEVKADDMTIAARKDAEIAKIVTAASGTTIEGEGKVTAVEVQAGASKTKVTTSKTEIEVAKDGGKVTSNNGSLSAGETGTTDNAGRLEAETSSSSSGSSGSSSSSRKPNTAALEAAITAATAADAGVIASDKPASEVEKGVKFVTPAEKQALADAIAAARAVLNNPKNQSTVNQAVTALNSAVDAFNAAIQTGTNAGVEYDTTALEAAITAANTASENVIASDKQASEVEKGVKFVTPEEKQTLTDAIAAAQAVLDNPESQSAIDQAAAALNSAADAFTAAIQTGTKEASSELSSEGFPIFDGSKVPDIYVSKADDKQIVRVVNDLQADIERVSENKPEIKNDIAALGEYAIIVGSIDKSQVIQDLMASGKLNEANALSGKWESYVIKRVADPLPGVKEALVVAGSDKRGAVYGAYDISEQIGVSPWYYWGDIAPEVQSSIYIKDELREQGEPSVKYRGIFINDEQNLARWAAQNDPKGQEGGNIGPDTYAKVYELLLRLKANYLWTAMHSEPRLGPTDHFNKYAENRQLADEYGVVLGTSHCEPMMRNGTADWFDFLQEKGFFPGKTQKDVVGSNKVDDWMYNNASKYNMPRYDYSEAQNRDFIDEYWQEGVDWYQDIEVSYTLGMRGLHDGGFRTANASNPQQKLEVLQDVVDNQIQMMRDADVEEKAGSFPIFIPYKEVLPLYEEGLKLPEETTIVWAEDNFGFIRRFPTAEENEKYAGSGVYYHVSYVGSPQTYIWLNSTPPGLMLSEMGKAYESGVQQLWVLNVGDLKPSEIGIEYFLDMALDIDKWTESNLMDEDEGFFKQLSEKWFPDADSDMVAGILEEYYRLNFTRRPEFSTNDAGLNAEIFDPVNYGDESMQRLADFQDIAEQCNEVIDELHEKGDYQEEAFYLLVAYPVFGSYYNNLKYYYTQKSNLYREQGRTAAANLYHDMVEWAQKQQDAAENRYNSAFDGKWDPIMKAVAPVRGLVSNNGAAGLKDNQQVAFTSGLGVVAEGERKPTEDSELSFSAYSRDTRYIDLFNTGAFAFDYEIEADADWVIISEPEGTIYDEQRVFITIDWDELPTGDQKTEITVMGADEEKTITLSVNHPAVSREEISGYAEANGYVAIEAEHFSENHKDGETGFIVATELGRSGDSVSARPMTADNYSGRVKDAPYVSYDVYFQSAGRFDTTVYRLPTLGGEGQRIGIAVDDGEPIVLSGNNISDNDAWKRNVMKDIEKLKTTLNIATPGYHTIKLYMVDPGVAVDRIVINTGGEVNSAQGPMESYHSRYNTEPWTPKLLSMEQSYLDDYIRETFMPKVEELTVTDAETAAFLQSELEAVKASLEDMQDDTVRRGYARLAAAIALLDSQTAIDERIAEVKEQAQQILDSVVPDGSIPIYDFAAITEFFAEYPSEIPDDYTFQQKVTYYNTLQSVIQNARIVKLTADSEEATNVTENAMDGNADTRWAASGGGYPRWISVDLGAVYDISRIDISWFRNTSDNRVYKYKISTSTDGENYTEVLDRTNNNQKGTTSDSLNATARYVKIDVTDANGGSASIYEIVVFGEEPTSASDDRIQELKAAMQDAEEALEDADAEELTIDSYVNLRDAVADAADLELDELSETQVEQWIQTLRDVVDGLAEREYTVEDHFDDLESLDDLGKEWNIIKTVGEVTLEEEEDGNKYLKINQTEKSKGNSVEARRSFDALSGKVYIEVTVRSDTPASFVGLPFLYKDTGMEKILTGIHLRDNGQIKTNYLGNNNNSTKQVGSFKAEEWNTVTLIVDTDTDTMQVYVNGELKGVDFQLRNATDALGMLRFYTDDSDPNRPNVTAYFDDVLVYQEKN